MDRTWTPQNIKLLRQRLGWTRAEFSRRIGVRQEMVLSWEEGQKTPDGETINQLRTLLDHLQSYNLNLSADPLAEIYLAENNLNQTTKNKLKNDLESN